MMRLEESFDGHLDSNDFNLALLGLKALLDRVAVLTTLPANDAPLDTTAPELTYAILGALGLRETLKRWLATACKSETTNNPHPTVQAIGDLLR